MKILKATFLVLIVCVCNYTIDAQTMANLDFIYSGIEFEMNKIQEPVIRDAEYLITDFGGVGDGIFKNTDVFEKTIGKAISNGGGTVVVPPGIWLTGPITLASNVNLHIEKGALIQFSKDFEDYPLIESSFEGLKAVRCTSPINARAAENIAITGEGVIDGSGGAWRPVKKGKMTEDQWGDLLASGGVLSDDKKVWFPSTGAKKGYFSDTSSMSKEDLESVKGYFRPVMVSLVKCKNILLDGPTFQNSPAWNIHPLMSENIIIRNLTIRNPWYSQNGDGLDVESCKNVLIYNNTFDVGDDAICIKSGKNKNGRDRGMPTENVIIKDNIVYHGHGGFVIGSEMSGGVKNVHVSNCTFMGTDTGLRFKSTRGRGGIVENIYISDIYMTDIPVDAIRFNLFYGGKTPALENMDNSSKSDDEIVPVTEETPSFQNIFMKNIYVAGAEQAGFFMGLPEMNLKNIHLENAIIKAKKGLTFIEADGIILKDIKLIQKEGKALVLYNSKNVEVNQFDFENTGEEVIKVFGDKTENIQFSKDDFENIASQIKVQKEISKKEIIIN